MEYYSVITRNALESVWMRWMNLEPIIRSEVSQKEKDSYCKLTYIYIWNLERWYWWTYLQDSKWRRRHREQTCGHSGGRRGRDELRVKYGKLCIIQFNRSVMSDSAACQPSLSITNSRSLLKLMSIKSVMPLNHFSSCLQSFPASGFLSVSYYFPSSGQSIGVSASASVLPMGIQDWFPLELD